MFFVVEMETQIVSKRRGSHQSENFLIVKKKIKKCKIKNKKKKNKNKLQFHSKIEQQCQQPIQYFEGSRGIECQEGWKKGWKEFETK